MILKYILLGSFCWNFHDTGTQFTQWITDNISDALVCKNKALEVGRTNKAKIEELGGFMDLYDVSCIAIDETGYNVYESFEIYYNIL